jgi:hypothetical protein
MIRPKELITDDQIFFRIGSGLGLAALMIKTYYLLFQFICRLKKILV